MSFEIGSDGVEVVPYETEGYSIGGMDSDTLGHSRTVIDESLEDSRFHDPSPEEPMEASKFLSFLGLNSIVKELMAYYKDLDHFHYPIDAMLRTIIYQRLVGLRHTTQLETKLNNSWNHNVPRNLGFIENEDGMFKVPNRRTIDYFIWKRLGRTGTSLIFDMMVSELRTMLARRRMKLGRIIAVDSTPLEVMHGDPDAEYNGHYELSMYKIHQATCAETGLSLAKIVSRANDYDGDYLIPLVRKLQRLGIDVETIIGDHHYGSFSNYARLNLEYGVKLYCTLSDRDRYRYDGTPGRLKKQYNAMWKESDYTPNADIDYILKFLLSHGVVESVGAYFRNEWLKMKEKEPKEWQQIYNKRQSSERFHAHVKEQLGLERNLRVKGINSIDVYTNLFWIAEIAAALTRVQNGTESSLLRLSRRDIF